MIGRPYLLVPVLLAVSAAPVRSEEPTIVQRLRATPGYERYEAMSWQMPTAVTSGAIEAEWSDDSTRFDFVFRDRRWRFDMATLHASELSGDTTLPRGVPRPWRDPDRGPVAEPPAATSPDGRFRAIPGGDTLSVHDRRTGASFRIPGESRITGVTYGRAPAGDVEPAQREGMWWSPDSRRLAYLRVEPGRPSVQTLPDREREMPNPVVDVVVHDIETNTSTKLAVRAPGTDRDEGPGYYINHVGWSPNGAEVLLRRLNRRQNHMELAACAPATGACRILLAERWPAGWVSDQGKIRWLADGRRFIWRSERTGVANLYLYTTDGVVLTTLTRHAFAVEDVIAVDESARVVFYSARDGDNVMKVQLHRVGLDGAGDVRLTDPAFHHTVRLSPDRRFFVDVLETHAIPPMARVADSRTGAVMAEIARSDMTRFTRLGLKPVELFRYLAGDGSTELAGSIQYPSTFDPLRTYPVLVSLYNAPESSAQGVSERFTVAHPATELGFLIVTLETRSSPGRGKRPLDAIYRHLGDADVDDLAEGIRTLGQRPYVDRGRIGVYGTSYGGYAAIMLMLRQPALVAAAVASSPVTMWEQYNAAYTERYMGTAEENPDGYRRGSAIAHAARLRGPLLLYYGTADRNVLPRHSRSLIDALEAAGKPVEVEIGSGQDHTSIGYGRLLVFFLDHLVASRA